MQNLQEVQEKVKKEKKKKSLASLATLVCGILLLIGLAFSLRVYFDLREVTFTGNQYYSDEELREVFLTSPLDQTTVGLYLKVKTLKDDAIPFIEETDVDYVNHHSLKIGVYEKVIIGSIRYMNQYLFFDKDGIVVETSSEPKEGIPFISGLKMQSFSLYSKMEIPEPSLLDQILNLSQLVWKYEIPLDEIRFSSQREVTLYDGDIEIPLGRRDMYDDQIAELSNLLPEAEGLSGILDMRDFVPGQSRIILREK